MNKYNRIVYYYDSFSIVVINPSGKLRRLYTPFLVKCIKRIDDVQEYTCIYVDEVFKNQQEIVFYKIGGKIYNYKYFSIQISF